MNRVVTFGVLGVAVAFVPAAAPACAPVPHASDRVDVASESAVIVWDEATKTEHFIRRASFQSTGYDFGFLVPTPAPPELGEAGNEAFDLLARVTAPKLEVRKRTASPGCFMMSAKFSASEAGGNGGVVVFQQKRVGDFDAVTVGFKPGTKDDPASGAAELAAWLVRYGYGFGDTLKEWLVPYVRDRWVVTAFRIVGQTAEPAGAAPGATGRGGDAARPRGPNPVGAAPVRMSFKTDRPFFPYREPADQRDEKARSVPRLLRVYFVAEKRYAGALGDGSAAWPGRTVWADRLQAGEWSDLAAKVKLPAVAARDWWLTEFEDRSTPRPGTDEVYFAPAPDQSPVARPPVIAYTDDWTPWYVGLALAVGLPALTAAAVVARRVAASPRRG
jgi:hypothetical protein